MYAQIASSQDFSGGIDGALAREMEAGTEAFRVQKCVFFIFVFNILSFEIKKKKLCKTKHN